MVNLLNWPCIHVEGTCTLILRVLLLVWSHGYKQKKLLYLPTQIRFLSGGERVTCHWSKLHDALGRTKLHDALGQQQLELSTHTWSGRAPLKRRQICTPADVKQIIFICVLFYFELGGITKHLMTGPSGNSEFCFPSTSMFPSASPRGTMRVSGKQNSLFPLGPVIKCLLFTWNIFHSSCRIHFLPDTTYYGHCLVLTTLTGLPVYHLKNPSTKILMLNNKFCKFPK